MTGILAAAATLLLHTLFVTVAIWGGSGPQNFPEQPEAIGAGANRGNMEGKSTERRIVVRWVSPVTAELQPSNPDAYLAEMINASLKLEITGPDAVPLPPLSFSAEGNPADSPDAELIARARMMGIYESQTRARIERAWTLPEGWSGESFDCRALIRQRSDGRIIEVELPYAECEGSPQMRQSLVDAIFTASPLPAPPHPGMFVDSFSLQLHAESARNN